MEGYLRVQDQIKHLHFLEVSGMTGAKMDVLFDFICEAVSAAGVAPGGLHARIREVIEQVGDDVTGYEQDGDLEEEQYKVAILGATVALGRDIVKLAVISDRIYEVALVVPVKLPEWEEQEKTNP